MTALIWDDIEHRGYEAGVDRGVVYPMLGGVGVPWNGLLSVTENLVGGETSEHHLDGVKYLDFVAGRDYQAVVTAFSAPEELPIGSQQIIEGFELHRQSKSSFNFSYRTGMDEGYKIHMVYNCLATPAPRSSPTIGDTLDPAILSWTIDGIPVRVPGFKPAAHFIVESPRVSVLLLSALESLLYGTPIVDPAFPSIDTLTALFEV